MEAEPGLVAGLSFHQVGIVRRKPEIFEAELDEQSHVFRIRTFRGLAEAFPSALQEVLVAHDADLRIHSLI